MKPDTEQTLIQEFGGVKTAMPAPVSAPAFAPCRLCPSRRTHLLYRLNFAELWRCRDCDAAFLHPMPTAEQLATFYNNPDYHGKNHPNYWDNCKAGYSEEGAAVKEFKALLDRLPVVPAGRLLDIGCATGVFMDLARKRGWDVKGVELSAYASGYARDAFNLDVFTGELTDARFADGLFDAVTAWDVFEHLADPVSFLKEVRRVLKPGGTLFITTVQYTSLVNLAGHLIFLLTFGKVRGPLHRLYGIHHIYYFSRRSMRQVLARGGFEVVDMRMTEFAIERISELSPLTRLGMKMLYALQKVTGMTTVITVLAKKNN